MDNFSKGTIVRTVVLMLALTNQILTATGNSVVPVDSDIVAELISIVITAIASGWAWWKNNSFSKPAIEADRYLRKLKKNEQFE